MECVKTRIYIGENCDCKFVGGSTSNAILEMFQLLNFREIKVLDTSDNFLGPVQSKKSAPGAHVAKCSWR